MTQEYIRLLPRVSIYMLLGGPSPPPQILNSAPNVALAPPPPKSYLQSPFMRVLSYEYKTEDTWTIAENEASVLLSTFMPVDRELSVGMSDWPVKTGCLSILHFSKLTRIWASPFQESSCLEILYSWVLSNHLPGTSLQDTVRTQHTLYLENYWENWWN